MLWHIIRDAEYVTILLVLVTFESFSTIRDIFLLSYPYYHYSGLFSLTDAPGCMYTSMYCDGCFCITANRKFMPDA